MSHQLCMFQQLCVLAILCLGFLLFSFFLFFSVSIYGPCRMLSGLKWLIVWLTNNSDDTVSLGHLFHCWAGTLLPGKVQDMDTCHILLLNPWRVHSDTTCCQQCSSVVHSELKTTNTAKSVRVRQYNSDMITKPPSYSAFITLLLKGTINTNKYPLRTLVFQFVTNLPTDRNVW